jgi:Toprim-like
MALFNFTRIKRYSIVDYMSRMGYRFVHRQTNGGAMYHSPLRADRSPSFSAWPGRDGLWRWFDSGTGQGGDIIDLHRELTGGGPEDLAEFLESNEIRKSQESAGTPAVAETETEKTVTNRFITRAEFINGTHGGEAMMYLLSRGLDMREIINADLWGGQVLEQTVTRGNGGTWTNYYIAWKNHNGGYNGRNIDPTSKIKETIIPPAGMWVYGDKDSRSVVVCEAIIDGLSFRAMDPLDQSLLVSLNSTNNWRMLDDIDLSGRDVRLMLDNDTAGDGCTAKLMDRLQGRCASVVDARQDYIPEGCKDVNEALVREQDEERRRGDDGPAQGPKGAGVSR